MHSRERGSGSCIFGYVAGIIYGLFLTLSTWVLFYTATHKNFFENNIGMFSLNYRVRGLLG